MNVKLLVANITITVTVGSMKRNCMVLNCVRRREHSYIDLAHFLVLHGVTCTCSCFPCKTHKTRSMVGKTFNKTVNPTSILPILFAVCPEIYTSRYTL